MASRKAGRLMGFEGRCGTSQLEGRTLNNHNGMESATNWTKLGSEPTDLLVSPRVDRADSSHGHLNHGLVRLSAEDPVSSPVW